MSKAKKILDKAAYLKSIYDADMEKRVARMGITKTTVSTMGTLGVASQQNVYATNSMLGYYGTTQTSPLALPGIANANVNAIYQQQQQYLQQHHAAVPAMTGQKQTISFADADGRLWAVAVDLAYIPYMQAISAAHSQAASYIHQYYGAMQSGFPSSQKQTMVEGDFSMEEMEKAFNIIEELNADQPSA